MCIPQSSTAKADSRSIWICDCKEMLQSTLKGPYFRSKLISKAKSVQPRHILQFDAATHQLSSTNSETSWWNTTNHRPQKHQLKRSLAIYPTISKPKLLWLSTGRNETIWPLICLLERRIYNTTSREENINHALKTKQDSLTLIQKRCPKSAYT